MLLIYTEKTTKRLKYIFKLIFNELLNTEFSITNNIEEFTTNNNPKINYSHKQLDNEIFIYAHNLLFKKGIDDEAISLTEFKGIQCPFPTYNSNSSFPFDPFAAIFYLVSRYEEYLPHIKDKYGRYSASESIAFKNNFLQKPVVNIWAYEILELINQKHNNYIKLKKTFKYIPTIDIDLAYAYKHKGLIRSIGGIFKSLQKLNFNDIRDRFKVIFNIAKDPFDTYDFQIQLHNKFKLKPIYFILFGDYDRYDKNLSYQNSHFRSLVKSIGDYAEVGFHPSFLSNKNTKTLKIELYRLSEVLNKEIIKSRQHFLIMDLPSTYRNLINLGIQHDYTMGYASEPGFRAGICSSFYYYDLDMETETKLRIHPFMLMEASMRFYKNFTPEKSLEVINNLINETKKVNGTFISLWHNASLSNKNEWEGWKYIYEEMIKLTVSD